MHRDFLFSDSDSKYRQYEIQKYFHFIIIDPSTLLSRTLITTRLDDRVFF